MSTPLRLKRSAVSGKRPGLSDLQKGGFIPLALTLVIDNGKFGDAAKTSQFYLTLKTAKESNPGD